MRAVLLLLAGLAAGLGAGWALFAKEPVPERAPRAVVAPDVPATPARATERAADELADEPAGGAAAAPEAGVRRVPTRASEEALVRKLISEAYAESVKGERAPEPDLLDAAVRETLRKTAEDLKGTAHHLGRRLEYRERMRAQVGEISVSPLMLQMRMTQSGSLSLLTRGNSGPLRIDGPPGAEMNERHVTGGTVPPGRTFLIERVVVRAYLGPQGSLEIRLPQTQSLKWAAGRVVNAGLNGLTRLRHGEEDLVQLVGYSVAASVEIHGHLVAEAEGESTAVRPLVMGDGWLTGEPVLMQVLADHGGGNPNTVHLDGKLSVYVSSLASEDVWTETPALHDLPNSLAYYRGCGRVPAGKALRITRVVYRAQLDPEGSNYSYMVVRIGGTDVFKTDASKGPAVSGAWNGDGLVSPGGEQGVSLTCAFYALGEMIVYGELVDDPRDAATRR